MVEHTHCSRVGYLPLRVLWGQSPTKGSGGQDSLHRWLQSYPLGLLLPGTHTSSCLGFLKVQPNPKGGSPGAGPTGTTWLTLGVGQL